MIKKLFRISPRISAPDESDLFLCFGIEGVFYGAFLYYPPVAYIVAGLAFIGLAFLSDMANAGAA